MTDHYERIHLEENDPKWNMPHTPAIKIHAGKTVYLAGVTAAPIYHSHPHIAAEFDIFLRTRRPRPKWPWRTC